MLIDNKRIITAGLLVAFVYLVPSMALSMEKTVILSVPSITTASDAEEVWEVLSPVDGIVEMSVSYQKHTVIFQYDDTSLSNLAAVDALLKQEGYTVLDTTPME